MSRQENAARGPFPAAGETSAAASISVVMLQPSSESWKPSDPGTVGLASEIRHSSTSELREQVRLLLTYDNVFGASGNRRQRLVIAELGRRMAVRP